MHAILKVKRGEHKGENEMEREMNGKHKLAKQRTRRASTHRSFTSFPAFSPSLRSLAHSFAVFTCSVGHFGFLMEGMSKRMNGIKEEVNQEQGK